MNIIINTVMVICFINSMWWMVGKLNGGHLLVRFVFRTLALVGTVFPVLYFLKIFNII